MSATPEVPPPLVPATAAAEASAPIAALEPEERGYLAARTAFLAPERSESSGVLLLVTMVLFALSMQQGENTWEDIALLVAVVLFHELGHWVGMRLFGFQDVKMFFIPFMGAAVSGRNTGAVAWKEALVLLMGPMPGLMLGFALLLKTAFAPSQLMANVGVLLVSLNAFNLLPLTPLDGGKLFQLLIFSRNQLLEILFTVFAGLALLGLAFVSGSWVLGIVAGLLLLSIPRQRKVLKAARDLRASDPAVVQEPAALGEPSLRSLYVAAAALVPPRTKAEQALTHRVRAMRDVHHRTRLRPPSVLASLGLVVIWGVGVVVTLGALYLIAGELAPRAPRWETFTDTRGGYSVLMPLKDPSRGVVSYGAQVGRKVDGETRHARLGVDHDYSVTHWKLEKAPGSASERDQLLEEVQGGLVKRWGIGGKEPSLNTERELNGIHGRRLSFEQPAPFGEGTVHLEYWFGLHEGRGYILRAEYDDRLASPEDVERFFNSFQPLPGAEQL
jgi:Zn-dependent protease